MQVLAETVRGFGRDDCPSLAAGLAFYTLFSLAPLLVIVVNVVAVVVDDPVAVAEHLEHQAGSLVGPAGAEAVRSILETTQALSRRGPWTSIGSSVVVFLGALSVLVQLQTALNRVWGVKPALGAEGLRRFLVKRVVSFAMLAILLFLLVVSLVVSAAVGAATGWLANLVPPSFRHRVAVGVDLAVSFVVFAAVFGAMFKLLPDARVRWRHVAVGACVTSALFVLGKSLIGLYLGSSALATLYGAAGSLAVVLVWVYYSALLVLFGAELTRAWSAWLGDRVRPEPGAEATTGP